MATAERKSKAELDLRLTEAEQERFFAFVEANTLAQAVDELQIAYGLILSEQAISTWAAGRRHAAANLQFYALLADIKHDARLAEAFGQEVGAAKIDGLTQANVAMLTQALFRAQREKNPKAMMFSSDLLSNLLQAVAKHRAGEASVIAAETSRDKFQFDAARAALSAAEDLYKIKQTSSTSEREKVERAVVRLFGTRPGMSKVEVNEDNDGSNDVNETLDIDQTILAKGAGR